MNLLYIYAEENRTKIEVNFNGKFNFSINNSILSYKKNNQLPSNFFGESITDIIALVGKNGSGKTSALENIILSLSNDYYSSFVIVYEIDDEYWSYSNMIDFSVQHPDFGEKLIIKKGNPPNIKPIFYSNIVDISKKLVKSDKFYNISSKHLMQQENFIDLEKNNQIKFALEYSNLIEQYIKIPQKIEINLAEKLLDEYYKDKINSMILEYENKIKYFPKQVKGYENQINDLFNLNIGMEMLADIAEEEAKKFKGNKSSVVSLLKKFFYQELVWIVYDEISGFTTSGINMNKEFQKNLSKDLEIISDYVEIPSTIWKDILDNIQDVFDQDRMDLSSEIDEKRNYGLNLIISSTFNIIIEKIKIISLHGETNEQSNYIILNLIKDAWLVRIKEIKRFINLIHKIIEKSIDERSIKISLTDEDSKKLLTKLIKEKNSDYLVISWRDISSGEYALLSMFSRINGVKQDDNKNVIITIDEGELYFHPDLQIKFINMLISFIEILFKNSKVKIIIATHSPFIISDLPQQNVYLLKHDNKKIVLDNNKTEETFGGNIIDILRNPFFVEKSMVGLFSKNKINKLIEEISTEKKLSDEVFFNYKKMASIIGEPYVKNYIQRLIESKENSLIQTKEYEDQITYYEEKIELLKEERRFHSE